MTTTFLQIRAAYVSAIRSLVPRRLAGQRFLPALADVSLEVMAADEAFQASVFRRFQIRNGHDEWPIRYTDERTVWMQHTCIIDVAYPKSFAKYGRDGLMAMDDLIRDDFHLIDRTIGQAGAANWADGQHLSDNQGNALIELGPAFIRRAIYLIAYDRAQEVAAPLEQLLLPGIRLRANLPLPLLSSSVSMRVAGSMTAPLPAPTLVSSASVLVTANLAAPLPPPVLESTATVPPPPAAIADLSAALPVPLLTASASVLISGSLAGDLPAPTLEADASVRITGGLDLSLAVPTLESDVTVTGGVPVDGPGSFLVPQSSAHWASLSLPAPLVQWNCQDSSGALAPAIGSDSLTANGSGHLYGQTITGWTRTFVGLNVASAQNFHSTSSTFTVALNQGWAWLVYMACATPAATTTFVTQCTTNWVIQINTTGRLRTVFEGSGLNDTAGPVHSSITTVRPYIFYRKSNSSTLMAIMSDIRHFQPAVSGAQDAITNTQSGLGAISGNSLNSRFGLAAFWKGTDADTISQRSTLVTLNTAPTWT